MNKGADMSFALEVGLLADLKDADEEAFESQLEQFAIINKVLGANGLREHVEPQELEYPAYIHSENGFGYRQLHNLRWIAVRLALGKAVPIHSNDDAHKDPVLKEYYSRFERGETLKFQHLIVHSDAEGYYVPVDFERVILAVDLPLAGGWLGSTQRLQAECVELAEVMAAYGAPGEVPKSLFGRIAAKWEQRGKPQPFAVEKFVCERLLAACEASLLSKAAICFQG